MSNRTSARQGRDLRNFLRAGASALSPLADVDNG
jgi:hypothetical protein